MSDISEPAPSGVALEDVPLKQRFYYYRGKVLRFRRAGFDADQAYWDLKNAPITTMAAPMLIKLGETSFGVLGTWYEVLPPTIYPLPPRDQNSLVEVGLSAHFIWTANTGSQTLLDWTTDNGTHFRRTFHAVVDRTDDSSVNEVDLNFAIVVSGTEPQLSIKVRQYIGPTGLTLVGTQTTAWPALQSYVLIADRGPTAASA
jgi:hypothetical protein